MQLKDQKKTRLKADAVTSYYPDRDVRVTQNCSYPSIQLTIGSCKLEVVYDKAEDRDADLEELDTKTNIL